MLPSYYKSAPFRSVLWLVRRNCIQEMGFSVGAIKLTASYSLWKLLRVFEWTRGSVETPAFTSVWETLVANLTRPRWTGVAEYLMHTDTIWDTGRRYLFPASSNYHWISAVTALGSSECPVALLYQRDWLFMCKQGTCTMTNRFGNFCKHCRGLFFPSFFPWDAKTKVAWQMRPRWKLPHEETKLKLWRYKNLFSRGELLKGNKWSNERWTRARWEMADATSGSTFVSIIIQKLNV